MVAMEPDIIQMKVYTFFEKKRDMPCDLILEAFGLHEKCQRNEETVSPCRSSKIMENIMLLAIQF